MINVIEHMPMAEYIKWPAVSASILRATVDECPRAAWYQSWLNPNPPPADDTDGSDKGSIAHAILLEGSEACCEVIDPKDHPAEKTANIPEGWTNKSIRAARDAARASGKIPILAPAMVEIRAMAGAGLKFIESLKDTEPAIWQAFQPGGGHSELTVLWQDIGANCRIRPDRISADRAVMVDVKTTKGSAHPDRWGRAQLYGEGYYTSAAFYRRGGAAVFSVTPDYYFLVIEQAAPYLCSLVGVDPAGLELGDAKVLQGLRTWGACVESGNWPAYPNRAAYPETPSWMIYQAEEAIPEASQIWGV